SLRGSNSNFSATMSGIGNNFQWQTNPIGCGWQNVPNANQYAGATTSTLLVNGLTVSNHNQRFRVIASKNGCADTSNVVTLTISDIAVDSINIINLKADTTYKGNRIRQLETDLANKHDTLYVGSTITTDTLNISIRTGLVSTSPAVNTLNVYPNPAATVLNIVLDKPGYYVAKLSGITAQTVVTPTSGTIDISGLANGIYILTISDSNNKLISINKVSIVK
ncbi:MAG: T9SS type A sorting domain-containing protein, partial [Bacteroidota bacterium]